MPESSQLTLHMEMVLRKGETADGQMLKDLRIACANGHNFLQAPSVQKIPGILVTILDYIVQRVTGRSRSFNEKVSTWDCVRNYGNQIRQSFSGYEMKEKKKNFD